jgi:hypothetical protein
VQTVMGNSAVSFTVDRLGNLWNIEIQQTVAPCLDLEVVKAFKLMPCGVRLLLTE